MTLLELEPVIYKFNNKNAGFYFWCPCPKCYPRNVHSLKLSVKWLVISIHNQMLLFLDIFGPGHSNIVPCKPDMCWAIKGNGFQDLSVTPSLDASAAGHWHGHITSGQIQ